MADTSAPNRPTYESLAAQLDDVSAGINRLQAENAQLKADKKALLRHVRAHCPDFEALYGAEG